MLTPSLIEVEGSGSSSSTPSQARMSAERSRTGIGISLLHVSGLVHFLDLTSRELSCGIGGGRLEDLIFLLWPSCKVGSGFSAIGSLSMKCRLQTLESLLGIQRVPLKLFLLIFFTIVISVPGSLLLGTGIIWRLAGSHTCLSQNYNHEAHRSEQQPISLAFLCPLLGQPMTTNITDSEDICKILWNRSSWWYFGVQHESNPSHPRAYRWETYETS